MKLVYGNLNKVIGEISLIMIFCFIINMNECLLEGEKNMNKLIDEIIKS